MIEGRLLVAFVSGASLGQATNTSTVSIPHHINVYRMVNDEFLELVRAFTR